MNGLVKRIILPTLLMIACGLHSAIITVRSDGNGDALTIQAGINLAVTADTVLVAEGIWTGSINIDNKSIVLGSYYIIDGDTTHISNTIIDGEDIRTGILITNCSGSIDTLKVIGFTIRNCRSNWNPVTFRYTNGGGIGILYSQAVISNCVIYGCRAYFGGGIGVLISVVHLKGNRIFKNSAIEGGGGVSGSHDPTLIIFDANSLNSVYNNYGPTGCDLSYSVSCLPTSVYLEKGSIDYVDRYFYYFPEGTPFSINEGVIEQVNHDLWVSPTGNDSNDGFSPQTPLKTIAYALAKIRPENNEALNVNILPGVYSWSLNQNPLSLQPKSYVNIIGSDTSDVTLDAEGYGCFIIGRRTPDYIEIRNLKLINGYSRYRSLIELIDPVNNFMNQLIIDNIEIADSWCMSDAMRIVSYYNVFVNRITIRDSQVSFGLDVLCYENATITNCIVQRLSPTNYDYVNDYCCPFFIQKPLSASELETSINIANCLVTDNIDTSVFWTSVPPGMRVQVEGGNCDVNIVNCTIANNSTLTPSGGLHFLVENCNPNIINTIVSGNEPYEVVLKAFTESSFANAAFYNSLVEGGDYEVYNPSGVFTHTWEEGNIFTEPLFLNTGRDQYWLSDASPCINAGTPDTTGLFLPLTDLAGNQRVWDGRIDMGCYEYGAPPVGIDSPELPVLVNGINLSIYPNPVYANGSKGSYSFIEFTLPRKAKEPPVVEIYNLKGQRVRSLTISQSYNDLVRKAGLSKDVNTTGEFYSTVFDCKDVNSRPLATGIYLIRVKADGRQTSSKMTIIR